METIDKIVQLSPIYAKIYAPYLENRSIAVFDIETTGLWGRRDQMILSGILLPDMSCAVPAQSGTTSATHPGTQAAVPCRVLQFFSNEPGDEAELIRATIQILSQVDIIVTYNGRSFDLPFLKARAAKYHIPCELSGWSLDLFSIISGYTDLKSAIGSLSQKTIERYMGLAHERDDEISGRESVEQFNRYRLLTSAGSAGAAAEAAALRRTILLHNHDDILQLYRILPILARTDLHRALYHQGFPAGDFLVQSLHTGRDGLSITASALPGHTMPDYMSFPTEDAPYSVMCTAEAGTAEITIPAEIISHGISILDLVKLLGREAADRFPPYPGIESGYLILQQDGRPSYAEINAFVLAFLEGRMAHLV